MGHSQLQLQGWRGAGAGQPLFLLSLDGGSASLGCKHHLQCFSQLRKQEAKVDVTEKSGAGSVKGLGERASQKDKWKKRWEEEQRRTESYQAS